MLVLHWLAFPTPRFGAVPSYRLVWVPSYSRAASGTARSADGREAYPSPYEGTANDVITAGLFRWNTADRRALHFPPRQEQCGAIR
jgi:hypothetical protein